MDDKKSSTFKDDMETYSQNDIIDIKEFKGIKIMKFNDQQISEKLKDWCIIYQNMGIYGIKTKLIENTMFFKILYCLLTNSVKINQPIKINDIDCNIDCYNIDTHNTIRVKVIDNDNDIIKIRKNSEYDSIVIINCSSMDNYKIYEIDNPILHSICALYGNHVKFNVIVKDYNLIPVFVGDIINIHNDFKTMTFANDKNSVKYYLDEINKKLIEMDLTEKKIQQLYKKMYHTKKVKKIKTVKTPKRRITVDI